ncbi:MAG: PAS domain S-box protein [Acidobacteria bacterium]|nr:PAS domain S-box protein [Acidobacteriota bacterium]
MTSNATTKRIRTGTMLLLFVGSLALIGGLFNLRDRFNHKPVPSDGVSWVDDRERGVVAEWVSPTGAAYAAGARAGDTLVGICAGMCDENDTFDEITEARYVQLHLDHVKDSVKNGYGVTYYLLRPHYPIPEGTVFLDHLDERETHPNRDLYLALIGLIYLFIGGYILLRQGRAPFAQHFFVICLLAYFVHAYSATLELRTQFDKAVDFIDVAALLLLVPALIHFAAIYPARQHLLTRRRWLAALIYLPAALLIAAECALRFVKLRNFVPGLSLVNAKRNLDTLELTLFAVGLIVCAALFMRTFFTARSLTVRQQLKWIVWGVSIAAAAFAVCYLPAWYSAPHEISTILGALAYAPLLLIPLTIGYSMVRYRLMDVDVVVRRSAAYILATLSVALLFGAAMASTFQFIRPLVDSQAATFLIATLLMSVLAMVFAPVKNWVQQRVDRLFYGKQYDYRMTLQDFGRALSTTTDLDPLLDRLMQRLKEVFAVNRLAILIEDKTQLSGYRIARAHGLTRWHNDEHPLLLPLNFAEVLRERAAADGIAFVGNDDFDAETDSGDSLAFPTSGRALSYYAPCASRSRIVAVIGLGRTTDGGLLSSEDLELLRAVAGYVAVAIENALLLEEQAQRANEFARLKEFNENIIESINVGVMVISLNGRITNWNGALEDIYTLPREHAIGKRISEVFHSSVLHTLRELTSSDAWNAGQSVNVYKFSARSADDRELTLNLSLAPLQGKNAEMEGTLVAIEDVTERVRLEAQLQQSDKLSSIGLLAAGVAHEVNTPLTGISSYSQMLMSQMPDNDPRQQLLEKIHRQTSRASSIVNNLLNFSRTGDDARFTPVDFNRVLDDTIQLLEVQLRNTEIVVERNYEKDLPLISGHAPKLQQVFMNLIINARDAMPQGGTLEITTESDIDSVYVSFRDTGNGIAPEHLAKIYDPFFTTKQIGKGTGLGLAVSYGIVQDHGGQISVISELNQGTTFRIAFPAIQTRLEIATD